MENSILKAKALYNAELEALGEEKAIPVIADDSGLIVDALPGQLGVRTARYGSPDGVTILPAHQKNQLLLKAMENIPFEKRGAKFVCSVTCIITPYKMYSVQEECLGHILFEETGTEGFGYDPVFFCKEANSPMGLLPNYSKNNYSHRSKAVVSLLKLIK
ncbi:MAG: non-canonical purine NTP pyrophosphatase, partial [Sphaerochaetaceae bacterium]|nr:non-canonical purine NTP pyrophosphatase [Sphaerochaetaceae bacterium]